MAESSQSVPSISQPPQPPLQAPPVTPLPPANRSGVLHRIIAPLSFARGSDLHNPKVSQSTSVSPRNSTTNTYYRGSSQSQTKSYRAGFDVAAVDINEQKTHAILAGREILKTVKIQDGTISDDVNLRAAVLSSTGRRESRPEDVNNRRQFLPAKDVRWSHGQYSHIVATAAHNGRIALYDVSVLDTSRMELAWLYPHTSQVNKLDFDPHRGYMLLSGSQDKTCKIWDIRNPSSPSAYNQYNARAPIRDVRWSPVDAFEFALCTENGVIQKWDVRFPAQAQLSINAHEKACYTIGWHSDGKHLVSGGLDKHLRVWDFKSDNRRQKPVFQLRTPQGIMNLAWRPPCWSAEFAEMGQWQSTQIATAYTDDDPRVHIWDLRRPLIPFREIDHEEKRPTDMLWASKSLLWTVGGGGIFTQTDLTHVPQVQDQLPPCAMDWLPDGSYVTFAEDRDSVRRSIFDDPTANFLSIPSKKLSGEDGSSNHSSTDDEDSDLVMSRASRRSVNTATTTRSAKSLGNTPPATDGVPQVLSLDKAVVNRDGLFCNEQAGSLCSIDGITTSQSILKFMTDGFGVPTTAAERTTSPERILERIEAVLQTNASICDIVSMHRTAQSWRIINSVLPAELKDWADKNRNERLEFVKIKEARQAELQKNAQTKDSSPFTKVTPKLTETKSPIRPEKTISNLFRGVLESERGLQEMENSSNMTTPMAKPLPDSPATISSKKENSTWYTLGDIIEPMPPLPPSVMNAHSTASIASKALRRDAVELPDSPISSPEKLQKPLGDSKQHKRSKTDLAGHLSSTPIRPNTPSKLTAQDLDKFNKLQKSPVPHRTQEERRAALKDYRAQTRPLFTLDAPAHGIQDIPEDQHGSADSFPMFSTSTDSSHRERFWGKSFDTSSASGRTRQNSEEWLKKRRDIEDDPPSGGLATVPDILSNESVNPNLYESEPTDFATDDSPEFAFGGMDGTFDEMRRNRLGNTSSKTDAIKSEDPKKNKIASDTALKKSENAVKSVSSKVIQQHPSRGEDSEEANRSQGLKEPIFHHSNPIKEIVSKNIGTRSYEKLLQHLGADERQDLGSMTYLDIDFRPIDFTDYEPKLPFAWSSLPLICQMIEFDQKEGIGAGIFSVHLIMIIHPFLFHRSGETPPKFDRLQPQSLAERLMSPELRGRAIANIFARHMEHLRRMNLYVSWAQIRKFCFEVGYEPFSKATGQTVGSALKQDQTILNVQCENCHNSIAGSSRICRACRKSKTPCPICEGSSLENGASALWCFCHKCGHSFHTSCMATWFLDTVGSHGQCPTPSCLCDCGPGIIRQQRYQKQHRTVEETDAVLGTNTRNGMSGLKKDPFKASHSPAVDRARTSLRSSTSIEAIQSGDEIAGSDGTSNSRRRSSWSRTGGSRGFGRSGSRPRNRESSSGIATPVRSGIGNGGVATPTNMASTGGSIATATSADSRRVRVITPREEYAP